MGEDIKSKQGSSNIFSDLGFSDKEAKEEVFKAQLGAEIFRILEHRKLTQTKAAGILGVKQSEISRLKSGKFSYGSIWIAGRSLERLAGLLYSYRGAFFVLASLSGFLSWSISNI